MIAAISKDVLVSMIAQQVSNLLSAATEVVAF